MQFWSSESWEDKELSFLAFELANSSWQLVLEVMAGSIESSGPDGVAYMELLEFVIFQSSVFLFWVKLYQVTPSK